DEAFAIGVHVILYFIARLFDERVFDPAREPVANIPFRLRAVNMTLGEMNPGQKEVNLGVEDNVGAVLTGRIGQIIRLPDIEIITGAQFYVVILPPRTIRGGRTGLSRGRFSPIDSGRRLKLSARLTVPAEREFALREADEGLYFAQAVTLCAPERFFGEFKGAIRAAGFQGDSRQEKNRIMGQTMIGYLFGLPSYGGGRLSGLIMVLHPQVTQRLFNLGP